MCWCPKEMFQSVTGFGNHQIMGSGYTSCILLTTSSVVGDAPPRRCLDTNSLGLILLQFRMSNSNYGVQEGRETSLVHKIVLSGSEERQKNP